MKSIDWKNAELLSGYLFDKAELNRKITINAVWNRFYDTGRIGAFKCDWKEGDDKKPHIFWDSDVAKWIEGAAYILQKHDVPELREKIEGLIDLIEKNQLKDGYFNTHYITVDPQARFTDRSCHELYCAGHLMEAGVAYFEATGSDRLLKACEKYADLIKKVFIDEDSAAFSTPGHEEIELALVKLYRATGKKKYLEMSEYFVNMRGNNEKDAGANAVFTAEYWQSHIPAREQKKAVGHSVRALYLYSAMADLAYELSDDELKDVCTALFDDITSGKISITGGVGASWRGEAFSIPYVLPNKKAYNETCAAIALVFFAQRMLMLDNNAKYADIIERTLYNGLLSGLSLDGRKFFYENPLEIDLVDYEKEPEEIFGDRREHLPITERVEMFSCSCCPPNLNRVLPKLEEYIYAADGDTYYINQFAGSRMEEGGVFIEQQTDYPHSGKVRIHSRGTDRLAVRKPYWCREFSVDAKYKLENGYIIIKNPPEEINIEFKMTVELIAADMRVHNLNGRGAVCRGPIVYCCEGVDNGKDLRSLFVTREGLKDAEIAYCADFGLDVITLDGCKRSVGKSLYFPYTDDFEPEKIRLIPYNCFANRGESDFLVWLNVK